jgi:hypothetical protein
MSAVVRLTKLPIIVTLAGAGTLALEMLAPRLLAPAFGTSQPIWAAVIGMTLLYLAIGYHIGGRLADGARGTDADMVSRIIVWAGVSAALIAPVAPPLISGARVALQSLAIGSFVGALIIALVLFATPIILLAAVSPFVSRYRTRTCRACVGAFVDVCHRRIVSGYVFHDTLVDSYAGYELVSLGDCRLFDCAGHMGRRSAAPWVMVAVGSCAGRLAPHEWSSALSCGMYRLHGTADNRIRKQYHSSGNPTAPHPWHADVAIAERGNGGALGEQ